MCQISKECVNFSRQCLRLDGFGCSSYEKATEVGRSGSAPGYVEAFKLMQEGKVVALWSCIDKLQDAPQDQWAEIIVKETCKKALEMARMMEST